MDEQLLEIRDYEGEGYQPLVDFGAWRVAILRFLDGLQPERQGTMERHMETDEVFVLTKGKGMLIMGGNAAQITAFIRRPWRSEKYIISSAMPGTRFCSAAMPRW